jgi:TPP-dependent trihydroxycyclohexane-1,2-dione (THcHDO) dehydratase
MTYYARQILPILQRMVEKPAKSNWIGTLTLTACFELVQKTYGCVPNPETVLEALMKNERVSCYLHSMGLPKYQECNRDVAIEFIRFAMLSLEQEIEEAEKAAINHFKGFR